MTDPNSELAESTDSTQETNHSTTTDRQAETESVPALIENSAEAISESTAELLDEKRSEEVQKKVGNPKAPIVNSKKGKPKHKKDVERKGVVSEKFSRTESRGFQLTADGLLRHFLACRVCCYFLSGVQVLYGREVVDRMVREFDGTWMYVPLTRETRSLLQKTYGVELDTGDFFIEHACEVCCRRFVIDLPEPEDFVASEEEELVLEEPERREPIVFEEARTREEREPDWGHDRPMMLVEFKHRR